MDTVDQLPRIVRWTLRLEGATALDGPVKTPEPVVESLFAGGTRGRVLRGDWLGHAVSAGPRDKRVGLVHAVTNGAAIGLYAKSYSARRRGRHGKGVGLALAGMATTGLGAYPGGHLAAARKVGSSHPAYEVAARGVST